MGDPVITPAFKFSKTDTSSILGGREGIIIVYERTFYHKWSPHKLMNFMSFILKGSQIPSVQLKGWFKSKNLEMENKIYSSLLHDLHGTCF